jgi:transposase
VVQSAKTTLGVRQHAADVEQVRRVAGEALRLRKEVNSSKKRLAKRVEGHAGIQRLAAVVGPGTAAVSWVHLGDPSKFHCGRAYLKALGLNLKERSSGFFKGQLKITKRGPSRPRRWLYFAALRYSQKPSIRAWYEFKKSRGPGHAKRALVALMRKLGLAMHQVSKGATFDEQALLPGASQYQQRAARKHQQRRRSHSCAK